MSYKIGDLGHVAPIHGDSIPEEGDCRYMAPELLEHDINRELLTKADIFSLGLTLFEAASLRELPKNSLEDVEYEKLKSGQLPYLDGYSKDFNNLLKVIFVLFLLLICLSFSIIRTVFFEIFEIFKFIFSKKATKIDKIFTIDLKLTT